MSWLLQRIAAALQLKLLSGSAGSAFRGRRYLLPVIVRYPVSLELRRRWLRGYLATFCQWNSFL